MAKIVLITGGSRGIGAATAILAAERGYDVAVNYRNDKAAAEQVVAAVQSKGQRAIAVQADVSVASDIERLYQTVTSEFGTINAVVNSVGISLGHTKVADTDAHALAQLFQTNVVGLILSAREAVKRLSTLHGGHGGVIVNVSSMAATIGGRAGSSHYAASKAAVDAFTTGLAKEVASEGIRVNAVRPGFTLTEMTEKWTQDAAVLAQISSTIPLGRPALAIEIAQPILWLLSDEASFVTGAHLDVSGGGFLIGGSAAAPKSVPIAEIAAIE